MGKPVPQSVFEAYAKDYDSWFDEHPDEYSSELARVRRILPSPASCSIEIGAGSGRFTAPLGIMLGIEPSRALSRMARQRGVEVILGRAEALPLKNGSCSTALLVTVLCFIDDPVQALKEIHRVLTSRGFLVIAFIERDGEIQRNYIRDGEKGKFLSSGKFYSQEEVQNLLACACFSVRVAECRRGFCVLSAEKTSLNSF
jgi:SAM-dependent methyltransferase